MIFLQIMELNIVKLFIDCVKHYILILAWFFF